MTAEARALRERSLGLDPDRVIRALAQTFAAWSAPRSRWREALAARSATFSRPVLDLGLREGLREWTEPTLRALRERELVPPCRVPGLTAAWIAGSIPTNVFAQIAIPLLAGSSVYAHAPRDDPHAAHLFRDSLLERDAEIGSAVVCGDDLDVVEVADAVTAEGSDTTVAELRARVPIGHVFVGYGHKLSIGAIGREADLDAACRAATLDLALWDGRGCLSPAYLLVEDVPTGRARTFASALAEALLEASTALPRGALSTAEEIAIRELRAEWALREGASCLYPSDSQFGVAITPGDVPPPAGLLRHVPIVPIDGTEALADWCRARAPRLSSIGHAGFGDRSRAIGDAAIAGGGSRVCPLGRMQLPPLYWRHDGMGPLQALVRFVDIEPHDT